MRTYVVPAYVLRPPYSVHSLFKVSTSRPVLPISRVRLPPPSCSLQPADSRTNRTSARKLVSSARSAKFTFHEFPLPLILAKDVAPASRDRLSLVSPPRQFVCLGYVIARTLALALQLVPVRFLGVGVSAAVVCVALCHPQHYAEHRKQGYIMVCTCCTEKHIGGGAQSQKASGSRFAYTPEGSVPERGQGSGAGCPGETAGRAS